MADVTIEPTIQNPQPTIIKYSPADLIKLNDPKLCSISTDLIKFFSKFPKLRASEPYDNQYNIYQGQPPKERKQLFKEPEAFTDEKIILDIKSTLSKLTEKNKKDIFNSFFSLYIPINAYNIAANIIHQIMIECIFMISPYIDFLVELKNQKPDLFLLVIDMIEKQFVNPRSFDNTNDAIAIETSVQKAKKWRINNTIIVAHLCKSGHYSVEYTINDYLTKLIEKITPTDPLNIEIIKSIIPILKNIPQFKPVCVASQIKASLDLLSTDKNYENRLRFLIMDIIDSL
jgi:hypothetical protein